MTTATDIIQAFLTSGEYNDEGDYVFTSDTPESGPGAEPDTMVPALVLKASAFLREDTTAAAARAMLAALIGLASEQIAEQIAPDYAPLIDNARAVIAQAEASGITAEE